MIKLPKYKLKKSDWIMICVFLIIIDILCCWCVNISVSAMINNGVVTNGFVIRDAATTYHIGLYGIVLASFGLISIAVHNTLRNVD